MRHAGSMAPSCRRMVWWCGWEHGPMENLRRIAVGWCGAAESMAPPKSSQSPLVRKKIIPLSHHPNPPSSKKPDYPITHDSQSPSPSSKKPMIPIPSLHCRLMVWRYRLSRIAQGGSMARRSRKIHRIASPSDGMVWMGGWLDGVYWMEAWHDGACNAAAVIIVPMGAWLMEPQDPSRRRMVQMRAWRGLHRPSHPDGMVWMGAWHDGARHAAAPSSSSLPWRHRIVWRCRWENGSM